MLLMGKGVYGRDCLSEVFASRNRGMRASTVCKGCYKQQQTSDLLSLGSKLAQRTGGKGNESGRSTVLRRWDLAVSLGQAFLIDWLLMLLLRCPLLLGNQVMLPFYKHLFCFCLPARCDLLLLASCCLFVSSCCCCCFLFSAAACHPAPPITAAAVVPAWIPTAKTNAAVLLLVP